MYLSLFPNVFTSIHIRIQCFPLYSLILATGNRTINYLSLDIEGAEFQVNIMYTVHSTLYTLYLEIEGAEFQVNIM